MKIFNSRKVTNDQIFVACGIGLGTCVGLTESVYTVFQIKC